MMATSRGVNEVIREWALHEDNALAEQLQQLEVEKHYSGNKTRNAIVRSDCMIAKDAQKRAQEEAFAVLQREERDARIAREIAERLQREENEKLRRLEAEDQRIAKHIQEREKKKVIGDINSVGLPLTPHYEVIHPPLIPHCSSSKPPITIPTHYPKEPLQDDRTDTIEDWPQPPNEVIDKLSQEKLDEELAKILQQEEETKSHLDRDRLLAIEVQDIELAKMLHQKEKARLKKVRERAKSKAMLKKQKEEEEYFTNNALPLPQHNINITPIPNIAMAIDPTYTSPEKPSMNSSLVDRVSSLGPGYNKHEPPQHLLLHPDILAVDDDVEAPPYMPVKGQKRLSKNKKKDSR